MAGGQLLIRIRCTEMPGPTFQGQDGVRLGVQRGSEVVEDVPGDASEVVFDVPLRVERTTAGSPNFLGPYAHGTVSERFLYLCWGVRANGSWIGFRRAKVQLKELPWEVVAAHVASGDPLEATVRMTDPKGEPLCATVKPSHIAWETSP
ncbi:MAG: DUF5990 family protein [Fimbriimonadaceae bacterium]|nr:DUF5990 family protein [Fimbriimonadaceae bacterium]